MTGIHDKSEKELARLKIQMEIVRTICPIISIVLQVIVLIKIL